ncbi:hypothetical protein [Pseudomonas sp. NPDC090592]|uniref:hypothetical protein n=1 Tax=Pseudomonas sp. NPDC090592 TaxID=3364480 RepID=UPI00383B91E9
MRTYGLPSAMIFIYCLASVLLPVFIINKLLYVPLILCSLWVAFTKPVRTLAPPLVFLVFLYGFLLSLLTNSDFALAKQMLLGSSTLFFVYLIADQGINMTSILRRVGIIFAALMSFMSLMILWLPSAPISVALLNFYSVHELGFYGVRQFGGLQMFMLHHRSSPFLLVPLSLFFASFMAGRRRDIVWVALIALCIFFTASRALMLTAAVAMFALFLYKAKWQARLATLLLVVPALVGGVMHLWLSTTMFSASETSNSIKLGHLLSFYQTLDVPTLLFGNGSGNYFFTEGYDRWVSQTEITWMDAIRFFGLPLSLLLATAILFPTGTLSLKTWDKISARTIIFVYLLMSFSNPVLFNSFGFIVVVWYWSVLLQYDSKHVEVFNRKKGLVNA